MVLILETEEWKFLEPVLDSPLIVWATGVMIYALNCVFVCMRPEMAMEFGFTEWNRCFVFGLPTDSPLFCFGTVKNSPGLCELDQKRPCVVCMKLFCEWLELGGN